MRSLRRPVIRMPPRPSSRARSPVSNQPSASRQPLVQLALAEVAEGLGGAADQQPADLLARLGGDPTSHPAASAGRRCCAPQPSGSSGRVSVTPPFSVIPHSVCSGTSSTVADVGDQVRLDRRRAGHDAAQAGRCRAGARAGSAAGSPGSSGDRYAQVIRCRATRSRNSSMSVLLSCITVVAPSSTGIETANDEPAMWVRKLRHRDHVVRAEALGLGDRPGGRVQRVLAVHDGLHRAGGAGGVEQQDRVVGPAAARRRPADAAAPTACGRRTRRSRSRRCGPASPTTTRCFSVSGATSASRRS